MTSNRHPTHLEERLPLALGRPTCSWRRTAVERLESVGRPYRLLYSSSNAGAVAAAVLAGLAVSVLAESGLRPGMRVLTAADGFPELPACRVGLVRSAHESSALADALAGHIISSLDNLSESSRRRNSVQQRSATVAPSTRTRVGGASSSCKPRRPPLQRMRGNSSADFSTKHRDALLLPERRDAADVIAGDALGIGRAEHRRALGAGRGGELLQVDLAVGRRQHADDVAGPRHQGLEQARWLDAERLRRLHADACRARIVLVFVQT